MKAYIIYIPEKFDINRYLNYAVRNKCLKHPVIFGDYSEVIDAFNDLKIGKILDKYGTPDVYEEIIEIINHEDFIIDTVTSPDSDKFGWILNINTTANRVQINGLELEEFEYENKIGTCHE